MKLGKGRGPEDVWMQLDGYRRSICIRNMRTEEPMTVRVASIRVVTLAKLPLVEWPPPDAVADAKRFGLWYTTNGVTFDCIDLVAATTQNCMCWVLGLYVLLEGVRSERLDPCHRWQNWAFTKLSASANGIGMFRLACWLLV